MALSRRKSKKKKNACEKRKGTKTSFRKNLADSDRGIGRDQNAGDCTPNSYMKSLRNVSSDNPQEMSEHGNKSIKKELFSQGMDFRKEKTVVGKKQQRLSGQFPVGTFYQKGRRGFG